MKYDNICETYNVVHFILHMISFTTKQYKSHFTSAKIYRIKCILSLWVLVTIWYQSDWFSTRSVFSYLCPRVAVTFSWVADYILTFVAIFHKYISFFQLGGIFKQRRRSLINSLFSLSQITLVDRKILVSKWICISNGLQLYIYRSQKAPRKL